MSVRRSQETIPGPAGPLEALLEAPENDTGRGLAVVCHPHPLYGGTMNNKVVYTVARAFLDVGMPTLRFNFRGVEGSAGQFADGVGETEDARAAIHWMRARFPQRTLCLGGFSFGGAVAIRAAVQEQADVLVTVAPAVDRIAGTDALLPGCTWLILQGDQDDLVTADATRAWVQKLAQPPRLIVLAGADHFFHARLTELRQHLLNWIAESKLA
ncbi:MAG TPA: alpha/beta family hydrolase [Steroidobacteraceae bacterium]|nr:alpha/beta family hydrolase [Steroidobacteraceae bacterium]